MAAHSEVKIFRKHKKNESEGIYGTVLFLSSPSFGISTHREKISDKINLMIDAWFQENFIDKSNVSSTNSSMFQNPDESYFSFKRSIVYEDIDSVWEYFVVLADIDFKREEDFSKFILMFPEKILLSTSDE